MSNVPPFFVTGGNLDPEAPSYVVRKADWELMSLLAAGEFCYLLDSRQVGKSSVMVRTVARLRAQGVKVCVIDLQAIGNTLDQSQWYAGLLYAVGRALDREDELDEVYDRLERFGPFQRWMAAFERVILPALKDDGRLVVFVDEIDIVKTLGFKSDEFFLGIREMHNRRSLDPRFARVTFCLLGSAAPADLIADKAITPFNIGHRIELTDFTFDEAMPLAAGFAHLNGQGNAALAEVLRWTGGHPYLTQRLCQAIAEEGTRPREVVDLCRRVFFSEAAKDVDRNLTYVRDRLLRGTDDPVTVLLMLRQIRGGALVVDESSEAQATIRLSGIVRARGRELSIRNEVYRTVFDDPWIESNLPKTEVQREERAQKQVEAQTKVRVKRNNLRTALTAVVVFILLALVLLPVYSQAKFAARKTETLGNLRQLSTGLQIYLTDSDDRFPPMEYGRPSEADMAAYLGLEGTEGKGHKIDRETVGFVNRLFPFVKSYDIYADAWKRPFTTDIALSRLLSSEIPSPKNTVALYETWLPDKKTRAVGYADGHVYWKPDAEFQTEVSNSLIPASPEPQGEPE